MVHGQSIEHGPSNTEASPRWFRSADKGMSGSCSRGDAKSPNFPRGHGLQETQGGPPGLCWPILRKQVLRRAPEGNAHPMRLSIENRRKTLSTCMTERRATRRSSESAFGPIDIAMVCTTNRSIRRHCAPSFDAPASLSVMPGWWRRRPKVPAFWYGLGGGVTTAWAGTGVCL
jgi:hypothetical protein